MIYLFSVFISNGWTSTREQECLLSAWQGLAKPTSGCWQGAEPDSLISFSADVAELAVRFFLFLESRKAHLWDSKGEGGGGQQGLSALRAFFKTELFIKALASVAER